MLSAVVGGECRIPVRDVLMFIEYFIVLVHFMFGLLLTTVQYSMAGFAHLGDAVNFGLVHFSSFVHSSALLLKCTCQHRGLPLSYTSSSYSKVLKCFKEILLR